jgi:hypothetical protein
VLCGFVLGLLISLILVYIVNPQSFHWTMRLHMPWPLLAAVAAALLAAAAVAPGGKIDGGLTSSILVAKGVGAVAAAFASVNIFGGFLVVRRMLAMYKKKAPAPKREGAA